MRTRPLLAALLLASTLNGCAVLVAGAAAGALVATDRRSSAVQLDDQSIEMKGDARLREQLPVEARIYLTSYNHKVLITGHVSNDSAKAEAERVVRASPHVGQIYNELIVGSRAGNAPYLNDTLLTSRVKTRLLEKSQQLYLNHVKVTSEAGIVYLMGQLTPAEAEAAVEIAATTSGVERVVKLFEYRAQ